MVSPSKRKLIRGKIFNKEERNKSLSYKPLNNKKFYLDIKNYRGFKDLKSDIIHLGGVVEDFLVKEVNYVITTRVNILSGYSSSENSSILQPSPNTPYTPSPLGLNSHPPSLLSASCDSPNLDSPKEDNKRKARTRAEVLLERACIKHKGTSDVIENARVWGIPVWSLSRLLKCLKELKSSPLYSSSKKSFSAHKFAGLKFSGSSNNRTVELSKSQKLKTPFVKVEAFNRKYRPHFKELTNWPVINLNCSEGTSPFVDPKVTQVEAKVSSAHRDNYQEKHKNCESKVKNKGGYCELCSTNYSDLHLHLQSATHLTFVRDNTNYLQLDELISKYAVGNLGETLYSGPSLLKEREYNDVIPFAELSSAAGLQQKKSPGDDKSGRSLEVSKEINKHCVLLCEEPEQPVLSEDKTVNSNCTNGENNSSTSVDLKVDEKDPVSHDESQKASKKCPSEDLCSRSVADSSISEVLNSDSIINSDSGSVEPIKIKFSKESFNLNNEMVRLIQEPISKICSQSLVRRGLRPTKRIRSVDCPDNNDFKKSKGGKLGLRSRAVSCHSERSDSEHSDDCAVNKKNIVHSEMVDKPVRCRKPKNNDSLENNSISGNSGVKVNGEVGTNITLNGANKIKSRRTSRTNSDDSDSVLGIKLNGIDAENDRVDINLLLEISTKDRKRFESKKAKIKRKNADWMLITETEKYYNEKEDILRNRCKDDSDSDSDCSLNGEQKTKPNIEENKIPHNYENRAKKCNKENKILDTISSKKGNNVSKCSQKNKIDKKSLQSKFAEDKKMKVKTNTKINSKRNSSRISNIDSNAANNLCHSLRNKTGSKQFSDKNAQKPKKRLSDVERFLRDNKEYYQFPETRDRLRRNASYGSKEADEDQETTYDEESDSDFEATFKNVSCKNSESIRHSTRKKGVGNEPNTTTPKGRVLRRHHQSVGSDSLEDGALDEKKDQGKDKIKSPVVTEIDEGVSKAVDRLYFSFEGAPVKESWYQTYQRYIDGVEIDKFEYARDPLRFILPYEMPKEYFRELQAKRSLLARKRNELAELVRKSPRCHASTLALFSDILPRKKKKKVIKTEEASSDGTSTPGQDSSKQSLVEILETDEELIFIGQCMEQVMNSAIEEKLSQAVLGINKGRKKNTKKMSRKKTRSRQRKSSSNIKVDKLEFSAESKLYDNSLAAEVDQRFLQNLPHYLKEVNIVPDHTFSKDSLELLAESVSCECIDRISCDDLSSDERTEISSESLSMCGSETLDSSNSSFPAKFRKSFYKKRRKNMTGWPKQKKRKPLFLHASEDNMSFDGNKQKTQNTDNDSAMSFDGNKPKTRNTRIKNLLKYDRRASPRKRSSVDYTDSWPVRISNK